MIEAIHIGQVSGIEENREGWFLVPKKLTKQMFESWMAEEQVTFVTKAMSNGFDDQSDKIPTLMAVCLITGLKMRHCGLVVSVDILRLKFQEP